MTNYVDALVANLATKSAPRITAVYPAFLAFLVKRMLGNPADCPFDRTVLQAAGESADRVFDPRTVSCESLGNSEYRVKVKDFNGQGYEIVVRCGEGGQ